MKTKILVGFLSLFMFLSMTTVANTNNETFDVIISAGDGSSFALQYDGTLWSWGWQFIYDEYLEFDAEESQLSPIKIMDNVVYVSTGGAYTAAIKADGSLWVWGIYSYGINGGFEGAWQPLVQIMDSVIAVSVGGDHVLAVKYDNSLWAWGDNRHGQIGIGTTVAQHEPIKIMENVIAVSAGGRHSMAITADGNLWGWGLNSGGELGDGVAANRQYIPVKIMGNVSAVSAGLFHTVAIRTDGSLWAWGLNMHGEVGDGTKETRRTPVRVMEDVIAISAGGDVMPGRGRAVTLAITSDNSLWAWGGDWADWTPEYPIAYYGSSPTKIMEDVVTISAGALHSIAVRSDGSVWTWGDNRYGQLGNGTTTRAAKPTKVLDNIMLPGHVPQPIITQPGLRFVIGQVEYTHDGTTRTTDVAPFIDPVYNRTMIPLRTAAEAFGAEANWNPDTGTAHITGAGVNLALTLDTPLPDGMGSPIMVSDRIFVPVAYVAQQFGATIRWDADAQAAYITLVS